MTTKAQSLRMHNIATVMQYVSELMKADKAYDMRDVVFYTMDKLNVSRRTATEYVELAFSRLNIK